MNSRIYPKEIFFREVKKYKKDIVWQNNPEAIAFFKREERKKKLDRIFNEK